MRIRINRVRLIAFMAEKEISINTLVEKAGISRVTVSSVRSGKTCSPDTAHKIASALEVPLNSLTEQEVPFLAKK